jgi:hypothetical protein
VRLLILAFAALFALSGCQKTSPPGEAPTGVTATPGDGLVVVSWDMLPDLTYWIFFQPGSTVDVATPNSIALRRVFSPRPVGPLANGTQYAFVMNATHNDSAAGPNSLPVFAAPRLAGATTTWASGTPVTPANLRSLAFNGGRFVAVGDATTTGTVTTPTILAGDFNYTNVDPPGVTAWMTPGSLPPLTPVSPPPGFTSNLSSVIFNGGAYVALGSDGSIISSGDGVNWVSNNPIQVNGIQASGMNGIAFGFAFGTTPTYVAVGNGGNIYTSNDLVQWNQQMSKTTSDLTSVSLLNGSFLATGTGGTLLTSPDGIGWNPLTSNTATTSTLRSITFSAINGIYAAVGDAGTIITSVDKTATWTPVVPAPLVQDLRGVTTGGSAGTRFLSVGQAGALVYSDDGLTWSTGSAGSASLATVLYASGMYLSVGDAGANAASR